MGRWTLPVEQAESLGIHGGETRRHSTVTAIYARSILAIWM